MQRIKGLLSALVFPLIGYRPQRVTAQDWDREYQSGKWDYLAAMENIAGLSAILGYCEFLRPRSVLDVGCGEGLLARRLKLLPYENYLGIDVSAAAIETANAGLADDRTRFVVAQADSFTPAHPFDLIVFNQSLYYLDDPAAILRRYGAMLTPNGRIIVSMYDGPRPRAAWKVVDKAMRVEDAMVTQQGKGRVTTKVLLPL